MNAVAAIDASKADELELTILMPCLNEAETIAVCIGKAQGFLRKAGISGEVLIADNGSTDGSQQIANELGARVVPVPQKGYGAALLGGITAARGRYVVMGDADDSYDFGELDAAQAVQDASPQLICDPIQRQRKSAFAGKRDCLRYVS